MWNLHGGMVMIESFPIIDMRSMSETKESHNPLCINSENSFKAIDTKNRAQ